MANIDQPETLEDGYQIWLSLKKSGLEESRTKDLPGYDAELVSVLKRKLFPRSEQRLEDELRKAPPRTEHFLEIFFGALKPFSEMLRDVVKMLEDAGARRSDDNLRIAFNFDESSPALAMTLSEFREMESFFKQVIRPVVVRLWNSNHLFMLAKEVNDAVNKIAAEDLNGRAAKVRDSRVGTWVEDNGRPVWLTFPGFPRSGHLTLDDAVGLAEELIHYFNEEIQQLGATYDEFTQAMRALPWEEGDDAERAIFDKEIARPRRAFVQAAHDFWANFFAEKLCLGVEAVNDLTGSDKFEAAQLLAIAIRHGFELPPQRKRTIQTLEEDFRELVNLPIWKKRHELYAVWVAGRIADALADFSWEWHPDGDTLRFPFRGAELATFRSQNGSTHVFWTEKKTTLKKPGIFGRENIQPDYRVMTFPTEREDATSLVVECKQYRKWSKKNFGGALDDYAAGCPKAPVILVNYGPTDRRILELVDEGRRDRTFLVGDFRPGNGAAISRFHKLVREAYTVPVEKESTGAIVALRWGAPFRDLDLHILIRAHSSKVSDHVGYGATSGTLRDWPWVSWIKDVTSSPPGLEISVIGQWKNAEYEVWVHDYSGSPGFPDGDVELQLIDLPDGGEHRFTSRGSTGRWWFVCRIHGPSGAIEEVNSVQDEPPDHLN